MINIPSSQMGRAALAYAGYIVLADVASALGEGVAGIIQTVLPTYNNPAHLGKHVDTRA